MKSIEFSIPGPPQGKARPKVTRNKYSGKSLTYTPDKTVSYEELTRIRFLAAARGFKFSDDDQIAVQITAWYPIPKSKSKSKKAKAAMQAGEIKPKKKPDWDNIGKIVCDALNGIAYGDDSQIVLGQVAKVYSANPRTDVRMWII